LAKNTLNLMSTTPPTQHPPPKLATNTQRHPMMPIGHPYLVMPNGQQHPMMDHFIDSWRWKRDVERL